MTAGVRSKDTAYCLTTLHRDQFLGDVTRRMAKVNVSAAQAAQWRYELEIDGRFAYVHISSANKASLCACGRGRESSNRVLASHTSAEMISLLHRHIGPRKSELRMGTHFTILLQPKDPLGTHGDRHHTAATQRLMRLSPPVLAIAAAPGEHGLPWPTFNAHWSGWMRKSYTKPLPPPWRDRKPTLVWRGSASHGYPGRKSLVSRFSRLHDRGVLDVRVTHETHRATQTQQQLADVMQESEQVNFKYSVYTEGMMGAYAWRLPTLLAQFATFMEVDVRTKGQLSWFMPYLKPGVHFIPVAKGFSDLMQKVGWAREHDAVAEGIWNASRRFVEVELGDECTASAMLFFLNTLATYKHSQVAIESEVWECPSDCTLHKIW